MNIDNTIPVPRPALFSPIDQMFAKPTLSENYRHIHTRSLVSTMERMGFPCSNVSIRKSRAANLPYTTHLLRFRIPSHETPEGVPEVIIINSHDGKSALRIKLGFFQMACANGCIVGDSIGGYHLFHRGITQAAVEGSVEDLVKYKLPELLEMRQEMKTTMVSNDDLETLCDTLNPLVFPKHSEPIWRNSLAFINRQADNKQDLWTVYQRFQENMIRGGQQYATRTVRPDGFTTWARNTRRHVRGIGSTERLNALAFDTCAQLLNVCL